ncbi:PAS domain S-box protein [Pseudochryseolinea flava]|uniref:histidine kinase n=1 Tax=Pseudochryseolinea flava TaxID=2059302 RepID=A0A364XY57_9BACT|nr:PAS domain S-box protein [Pseudochryseolinea flava]RAV99241.1 hypothetical protein DQQ10_20305 [Pseudochryseolinea flava]
MKSQNLIDRDFEAFFGALPGFVVVIDLQASVVAANDNFVNDQRSSREHVIGRNLLEIYPFIRPMVERVAREKVAMDDTIADGSSRRIAISYKPILKDGTVSFIVLQITDDTQATSTASPETNQLFQDLFEFNPAALVISGARDSKIKNVNASFLSLFEFDSKDELIGKTSQELKLIEHDQHRGDAIRALMEKQKVVTGEGRIRTKKGDFKWASISVILVTIDEEPCLMAVMIDITDRKNAEDKIKSINENLERTVVQKTKRVFEAELEYRSVIEQANDGIFISDSHGNYLDVNDSACKMLGYTKEELLKMNTMDVLPAEDRVSRPPNFDALMKGQAMLTTRRLQKKDGTAIPVEISARMLSNGKMLGIVRDITDRKRAEDAIQNVNAQLEVKVLQRTEELQKKIIQLQESEEKFYKAFHASSAGITITKLSDSTYADVNDAFLNMIGYSREEVINHSAADLALVVDMKHREYVLAQVREKGAVKQAEMTVRRKSGELIHVLSSIETITHNSERYAINIIYDITERKRAQEKLEAVNKELESFSYSVSHDLRAPLRSIMGYAEILQLDFGDRFDDVMKSHLNRITNSAKKMGRLIDDLLEFSRVGKLEIVKSSVETTKVVEKNIADFGLTHSTKPKFIIHELHPSFADFSMINQVWFNLISNAVKYSAKKEDPIIEIGSYRTNDEVVFFIKDNGAGFNMEFAGKLFGVFQRLHRAADFEGTGVGLALVKRIIDKHDGRIWASATVHNGATFYFALPMAKSKGK